MAKRRFLRITLVALGLGAPGILAAQDAASQIQLELNTVQDTAEACRLTFVAQNQTGQDIDRAVFETVMFDQSGSVLGLSLFDFRALPQDTPRVRQFDVPGTTCAALGRVLINGANSCLVAGTESDACASALTVSSRVDLELLG